MLMVSVSVFSFVIVGMETKPFFFFLIPFALFSCLYSKINSHELFEVPLFSFFLLDLWVYTYAVYISFLIRGWADTLCLLFTYFPLHVFPFSFSIAYYMFT